MAKLSQPLHTSGAEFLFLISVARAENQIESKSLLIRFPNGSFHEEQGRILPSGSTESNPSHAAQPLFPSPSVIVLKIHSGVGEYHMNSISLSNAASLIFLIVSPASEYCSKWISFARALPVGIIRFMLNRSAFSCSFRNCGKLAASCIFCLESVVFVCVRILQAFKILTALSAFSKLPGIPVIFSCVILVDPSRLICAELRPAF